MKEQTIFNEIFKEAKEKGFQSEVLISYIGNNYFSNTTLKLLYYTELQKWLRKEYGIHIVIDADGSGLFWSKIIDLKSISEIEHEQSKSELFHNNLEKGLQEALKLI